MLIVGHLFNQICQTLTGFVLMNVKHITLISASSMHFWCHFVFTNNTVTKKMMQLTAGQ